MTKTIIRQQMAVAAARQAGRASRGAASACRITTMTCTCSVRLRSAPRPLLIRRSELTAPRLHGCSSSDTPGSFALTLHNAIIELLRVDYRAMKGMIFGDPTDFEAVFGSITWLETCVNGDDAGQSGAAR